MVERIKNKRGFTIIEVMVVIALIGILAAVLVPQFGGVKNRAKDAGMLTNAKMVEAYVASKVDGYKVDSAGVDEFVADITDQFDAAGVDALVDPYTGATGAINVSEGDDYYTESATITADPGKIYVVVDDDSLNVYIIGFDSEGEAMNATKRTVKR